MEYLIKNQTKREVKKIITSEREHNLKTHLSER